MRRQRRDGGCHFAKNRRDAELLAMQGIWSKFTYQFCWQNSFTLMSPLSLESQASWKSFSQRIIWWLENIKGGCTHFEWWLVHRFTKNVRPLIEHGFGDQLFPRCTLYDHPLRNQRWQNRGKSRSAWKDILSADLADRSWVTTLIFVRLIPSLSLCLGFHIHTKISSLDVFGRNSMAPTSPIVDVIRFVSPKLNI